jgi:DNA-binding NtrC family response regulator
LSVEDRRVPRVLVVDDEAPIRAALERLLRGMDCEVVAAVDGLQAQHELRQGVFDLVLTDLNMPGADGFEVLRAVRELRSGLPAIVLTAHSSTGECVRAMRAGAADFIGKPFDHAQLQQSVQAALQSRQVVTASRPPADDEHLPLAALIGDSPQMQAAIEEVERVAQTDVPVVLIGEQGTGKRALARLVHAMSRRAGKSLVAFRCGSLDPAHLDRALFGENGASGELSSAEGGTLLVSQLERLEAVRCDKLVGELVQPARRGDVRLLISIDVDQAGDDAARELATTLREKLEAALISMPALRERQQDLPLLVEHFTELANRRLGRRINAHSLVSALKQYRWPGNLTELEARISQYVTEAPPDLQDEPVAEPNAFVVPVQRIRATLILDDGSRREVALPRGQGQSIEDLFAARELFVPVNESGGTRIYARSTLACVVADESAPDDDGLPHKHRAVRVTLRSGVVLEGELRYVAVEGRARVTDVLNEAAPSFTLYAGTTAHHIAKAHVRSIEER